MRVFAVGAHPDDPEIGCGGSMALHAAAGDRVAVLYATSGGAGSIGVSEEETAARRRAEAEEACAVLGAEAAIFLGFPDGRLHRGQNEIPGFQDMTAKNPAILITQNRMEMESRGTVRVRSQGSLGA